LSEERYAHGRRCFGGERAWTQGYPVTREGEILGVRTIAPDAQIAAGPPHVLADEVGRALADTPRKIVS